MGDGFAVMFGGPKAKGKDGGPSMGGGGDAEEAGEGEGMGGARKSAARAIAKALGSQNADVDSLDSALQAFVEACEGGGDYGK
jgi:hypothetical protein